MVPYANQRGLDGGFRGRHYMAMSRHPLTNDQIHTASNSFLNKCRKCQIIWGHGNKCKQIGRLIDITYLWICSKYCFSFPGIVRTLFVFHIIQILLTERLIAVWLVSQLKSDCTFSEQKGLVVLLVSKGKTIKILNCKSFVVWREIAWARQRRIKYNVEAEEKYQFEIDYIYV